MMLRLFFILSFVTFRATAGESELDLLPVKPVYKEVLTQSTACPSVCTEIVGPEN